MGVIYKLKPEVKDFILEQKRMNSLISCRSLVVLVNDKFHLKISKSSINAILKETGLSLPVGRRSSKQQISAPAPLEETKAEPEPAIKIKSASETEPQYTGAILLKAADYLIGGSKSISEAIKNKLINQEDDLLAKTESLIYLSLFGSTKERFWFPELWALIGKKLAMEEISSYLNVLQSINTISSNILHVLTSILQGVRGIKVSLSDKSDFYLDGQPYTIWSMSNLPIDFSSTICAVKSYINSCFNSEKPIILFTAPGYDIPLKEFFDFILGLDSKEKSISKIAIYNNKLEELEVSPIEPKRRHFVFAIWPWQFLSYRKVKLLGEFKSFNSQELKKELFVAEAEIELSQPDIHQIVTLKGAALKTNYSEKIRLVILSNLKNDGVSSEKLVEIYLKKWPNLEEAFNDFSRKIELFTYTARSHSLFSMNNLNKDSIDDIKAVFDNYLFALDSYVKWHFLPPGCEKMDFTTIKEHFYDFKATLKSETDYATITFLPSAGYQFLKELSYACLRLNERQIYHLGNRLKFAV